MVVEVEAHLREIVWLNVALRLSCVVELSSHHHLMAGNMQNMHA